MGLELDSNRLFYGIGEVAKILDVPQSTLRYWEQNFPQLSPKKGANGRRQYTSSDVRMLEEIRHLLKVEGVSIEQARHRLGQADRREQNRMSAVSKLMELKRKLQELQNKI